tara:strand:+ start:2115 stop:3053 length:939 start_codon:yes stop_codon:yes gene_type:complete
MTKLKTWGQCVKYTASNRYQWITGNGARAQLFNCEHVSRIIGKSFPVTQLDRTVMHKIISAMTHEHKAPATINKIISAVSTVLNYCFDSGVITHTLPSFKGLRLKVPKQHVKVYTMDEVTRLVNSALNDFNKPKLADAIIVQSSTGMRLGEFLQIEVKDVDFHNHFLKIGGRKDFISKGQGAGGVPIAPNSPIYQLLQNRSLNQPNNKKLFGDDWSSRYEISRAFTAVAEYAVPEKAYPIKYLRHTFCTTLIEQGIPLVTVQDLCDHSTMDVTLRYARATNQAKREAILALAQAQRESGFDQIKSTLALPLG